MMTKKNMMTSMMTIEEDDEDGEVSSKLEKAMTIGGFIIGAIIICILIFFIARAAGLVNIGGTAKKMTLSRQNRKKLMIQ